jgi:histidine ammonia-lyase
MAMLAERQLNYLLNDRLNEKLPAFLNRGTPGLNYGMQGMQFTATSTVAECQTLSASSYVHSIPNNKDNQDIVSMGMNGAMLAGQIIDNTFEVLAIHAAALAQAVDILGCIHRLSPAGAALYSTIRHLCPPIEDDKPSFGYLKTCAVYLKANRVEGF